MEEHVPENKGNNMTTMIAIAGLIVIVVAGVLFYQSQNTSQPTQTPAPTTTSQQPTQAQQASAYKNGSYSATGNYTSPGGAEEIDVTLVLSDGKVTDSIVTPKATRPISKTRQEDFVAHYKELVVGKNLDELALGKVSGSSLAPKGFNDAVEKIKVQAKS